MEEASTRQACAVSISLYCSEHFCLKHWASITDLPFPSHPCQSSSVILSLTVYTYLNTLFPHQLSRPSTNIIFFLPVFISKKAIIPYTSPRFALIWPICFEIPFEAYLCIPKQALLKLVMLMKSSPFRRLCKVSPFTSALPRPVRICCFFILDRLFW